jgi:hypothetical protein
MAEGSENNERGTAEGSKRKQRADWFGQTLGAEWVEIEPGIYRHRSPAPQEPDKPLDEELLEALPNAEQEAEAEPETSPASDSSQRRWFRR